MYVIICYYIYMYIQNPIYKIKLKMKEKKKVTIITKIQRVYNI